MEFKIGDLLSYENQSKLKVVVFCAPKRCGKDLAVDHLVEAFPDAHKRQFKDKLIEATANLLGITVEDFLDGYDETVEEYYGRTGCCPDYFGRFMNHSWFKEYPLYKINDEWYSKRTALIHTSENVLKPFAGQDCMGRALVESLPEEGTVFVSDSGFVDELTPVIEHVGANNVHVVRVFRGCCTFEGDSREYLHPEDFNGKVTFTDVYNNGTIEEYLKEVTILVEDWLR